jgi:hypothetical protein
VRFNPRRNEVQAVAQLLQEEFESYEDMAKAILQSSVDLLAMRESKVILVKFPQDDFGVAYGPFYHLDDLKKASQKAQEAGLEVRLGLMCAPARWDASEALETACVCGHQREQHVVKKLRNKDAMGPPQECGVFVNKTKCSCNNYQVERKGNA